MFIRKVLDDLDKGGEIVEFEKKVDGKGNKSKKAGKSK